MTVVVVRAPTVGTAAAVVCLAPSVIWRTNGGLCVEGGVLLGIAGVAPPSVVARASASAAARGMLSVDVVRW